LQCPSGGAQFDYPPTHRVSCPQCPSGGGKFDLLPMHKLSCPQCLAGNTHNVCMLVVDFHYASPYPKHGSPFALRCCAFI